MKKTKIFAVMMSLVVLASCSTSHDVVDGGLFQKRKYNKGFFISTKKKVDVKNSDTNLESTSISEEEKSNADVFKMNGYNEIEETGKVVIVQTEEVALDVSNEKEESVLETSLKVSKEVITEENSNVSVLEDFSEVKSSARKDFKGVKRSNLSKSSEISNTMDNTLLLVIIAIFIPFLAVGLYDGITTRFWISLLLTLLFWLPGVIYAILVVTGTI